jgi:DhnA family fructose-bisphosphate aldolase class Ia
MMQHGIGKIIRLGQLIDAESQHTVIVAIDHGLGGAAPGIEKLEPALEKIIAGKPDAIIMSMGVAKRFQHLLSGRGKPAIIITVDRRFGATLPGGQSRGDAYRLAIEVEDALLVGASAVKMVMIYGREDIGSHADNAQAVTEIARQCDRWRVPFMLEPVLWGSLATQADGRDAKILKHICRMGFEAGADILKINYTGDVETFREVVETCPIPIVILGGAKMETERDALMTAAGAIEAGAIGVAFGRNVFQHPDPTGMIRALRGVVHEGASVEVALECMMRET